MRRISLRPNNVRRDIGAGALSVGAVIDEAVASLSGAVLPAARRLLDSRLALQAQVVPDLIEFDYMIEAGYQGWNLQILAFHLVRANGSCRSLFP